MAPIEFTLIDASLQCSWLKLVSRIVLMSQSSGAYRTDPSAVILPLVA